MSFSASGKVDEAKRGFGGFSKHYWNVSIPRRPYNQLTWTNRRYTPADLRSTMPVQAHKFIGHTRPSSVQQCWVPRCEPPPQTYSAHPRPGTSGALAVEGRLMCPSSPATRSEEWSTLRQMLPSRGHYLKQKPEKWGTSGALALPNVSQSRPYYFPKINSPMTKYESRLYDSRI